MSAFKFCILCNINRQNALMFVTLQIVYCSRLVADQSDLYTHNQGSDLNVQCQWCDTNGIDIISIMDLHCF